MVTVANVHTGLTREVPKKVYAGARKKSRYVLIYIGAPYGQGEAGEVVGASDEYDKVLNKRWEAKYYSSNSWIFDREEWEVVK